MKNKKIYIIIFAIIVMLLLSTQCFAKSKNKNKNNDLDQINAYHITVNPRTDGSLDMKYHIEWEVLQDVSGSPLDWVEIGIPNSKVDNIKTSSKNVKSIKYVDDGGSYIKINFKKEYHAGDIITFDFSFHQKNMYELNSGSCLYEFTPGWFDDIAVKDMKVLWKAKNVTSSNADTTENDYLVWETQLAKGAKLKTSIEYPESAFTYLKEEESILGLTDLQDEDLNLDINISDYLNLPEDMDGILKNGGILFGGGMGLMFVGTILSSFFGTGYRRHGGYAYDDDYYGSNRYGRRNGGIFSTGSSRSSSSKPSCVSSCACACACAGGGRAGCSKKDFYGTNLRTKNIKKILDK